MIWQYGEKNFRNFKEMLNSCHPTMKFATKYSLDRVNFLDVKLYAVETNLLQTYLSNLRLVTNAQNFHLDTYIILKNLFRIARLNKSSNRKTNRRRSYDSQGKRCEFCTFIVEKITFTTNKESSDIGKIRKCLHLDRNFENEIYLRTCIKYKQQFVESCLVRFHRRFNNYRNCDWKFRKDHSVIQISFHAHFMLDGHYDWKLL